MTASLDSGEISPRQLLPNLTEAVRASCLACARMEKETKDNLPEVQQWFRAQIEPWVSKSWLMHRAQTKPRGYPGDFELLEGIYREKPHPDSRGIGEAIDWYFLSTILARGVVGRKNFIRDILDDVGRQPSPVAILDIASGPCREVVEATAFLRNPTVTFTAVDYDAEALQYAETVVRASGFKGQWISKLYNAMDLTAMNPQEFQTYDIIYSVGLFDYIPGKVVTAILDGTRCLMKPGARWILSFKDIERYDPTEYAWHADWHFRYRTEQDCRDLLSRSGKWQIQMTRDVTGVMMCFTLRLPEA